MAVVLSSLILHQIDHFEGRLTLSDLPTALDAETARVLREQIVRNRDHVRAQRFPFDEREGNVVREAFDTILDAPGDDGAFVAQSRAIAAHLLDTIRGNRSVSPGDLLVCAFRDDDHGDPWLAILKMQPESAYVRRVEGSPEQHNVRVVLEVNSQTLTSGVLQKAAFILPPSRRSTGHDLTVLDQQAAQRGDESRIAAFFLTRFLMCAVTPTDRQMTRTFTRATIKFARDHQRTWGDSMADALRRAVARAENSLEVNVNTFAEEYIPEESRGEYIGLLRDKGMPALVFRPQPPPPAEPDYVSFEGDNGLLVRVERGAFGQDRTVFEDGLERGKRKIVILTTEWRPTTPGRS